MPDHYIQNKETPLALVNYIENLEIILDDLKRLEATFHVSLEIMHWYILLQDQMKQYRQLKFAKVTSNEA